MRLIGDRAINGNPVKAQAVKGKKRTAIFKQLKAAGFTPSSVLVMPDGIIKIQFGERAVSAANDDASSRSWAELTTDGDN